MNKKLKVLVHGTGFAGQGHADAFRAIGAEVVGIVGRTPSVVNDIANKMTIPYFGTNWQQALKDCQPDIVSIGTPGGAHYEAITQAIEFGCHVFSDKPLTYSAETALELHELAKKKKVKTAFGATFRYKDGSYFHAMNAKTDPSSSVVNFELEDHIRITFTSDNEQRKGQWDFHPDRCDFTMSQISSGYKYWVQYEGVPGGEMDSTDFWFSSADQNSPRMLYMLHYENDTFTDNYVSRPDMTVLGFGRENKDKYLTTVQTFSIGFVESKAYSELDQTVRKILE